MIGYCTAHRRLPPEYDLYCEVIRRAGGTPLSWHDWWQAIR